MLKAAVEVRDLPKVAYASHRMLGASRMVGAQEFSEVCQAIAYASRTGSLDAIGHGMDAFEGSFLRMNTYINSL